MTAAVWALVAAILVAPWLEYTLRRKVARLTADLERETADYRVRCTARIHAMVRETNEHAAKIRREIEDGDEPWR